MGELYEDQAWLYDAAFDWDVSEETRWLIDRLVWHQLRNRGGTR